MKVGRRSIVSTSSSHTLPRALSASRGRIEDDEGNLHARLVEEVLLAQPVVAEIIAMVGREHDHRVREQAALVEEREELAELIVDLLDETHVHRHDFLAHLVAREVLADAMLHELAEDGMRIALLVLRAHGGNEVGLRIHRVVGRGRHIGPVRLDVRQMQTPRRIARLRDEIHRAPRHVRRLGILLAHAGGLARMAHRPARRQPASRPARNWPSRATDWSRHTPSG